MNPSVRTAFSAWIFILLPAQGCGPFFPDTVLDKPQAALGVPPVSYLSELYRLAGKPAPIVQEDDVDPTFPFLRQIPLESAELRGFWLKATIPSEEIESRILHYERIRRQMLSTNPDAGPMNFTTHTNGSLDIPVRPLGDDFPADVADYVEAARLHACDKTEEARALWKSILDRPPADRQLRAAWAAWMLAKTSPDEAECLSWYERVETEVQAGASDAIGLRGSAKGWRARRMEDPVTAMRLYYDAFVGGLENASLGLRSVSYEIFRAGDRELFNTAASDPLVRRLLNLYLQASLDSPYRTSEENLPPTDWLTALEAHATGPLDDAPRVAWALYSTGRYDESRKWLDLSPKNDPSAIWLQAKFDLRDGKLDEANQHLSEALRLRSEKNDWHPDNPSDYGTRWYSDAAEIDASNQSRLLADAGIVSLAREEYLPALESLRKGGYREDAAYVAECVISTDGLIKHVRKVAPKWIESENEPKVNASPVDPYTCLQTGAHFSGADLGPGNQLRYLLARRLAREKRMKEAREFMPPDLLPLLDYYISLDRARRSEKYSGEARAALIWRQALIHRHFGAELFSTDGSPDVGVWYWNFTGTEFHEIRTLQVGWKYEWSQDPSSIPGTALEELAIPKVTKDEISRIRRFSVKPMLRFHYRYAAADLAWEASRALPPNHPSLALLYNTAGQWISGDSPKAADRFYQAMVRRCGKTPEGQAADAKRWFLADLRPLGDLPALPSQFLKPPLQ